MNSSVNYGRMNSGEYMVKDKIVKIKGRVVTESDVKAMSYSQIQTLITDIMHEENIIKDRRDRYREDNASFYTTPEYISTVNKYTKVLDYFNLDKAWINVIKREKGDMEHKYFMWCRDFYESAIDVLPSAEIDKVKKAMEEK